MITFPLLKAVEDGGVLTLSPQHGCFLLVSASYRPLLDWSGKGARFLRKLDAIWENVESIVISKITIALTFYNKNDCSKYLKRIGITIAHYVITSCILCQ